MALSKAFRPFAVIEIPLLFERFRADFGQFLKDFGIIALQGIAVWCLLAPLAAALIYYAILPTLRTLSRRTAS